MEEIHKNTAAFIKCNLLYFTYMHTVHLYTDFEIMNFCLAQCTLIEIYLKILVFLQNVPHSSIQNVEFSTNIAANKTAG